MISAPTTPSAPSATSPAREWWITLSKTGAIFGVSGNEPSDWARTFQGIEYVHVREVQPVTRGEVSEEAIALVDKACALVESAWKDSFGSELTIAEASWRDGYAKEVCERLRVQVRILSGGSAAEKGGEPAQASVAIPQGLVSKPERSQQEPGKREEDVQAERGLLPTSAFNYEGFGREFIEHCQREQFFWDAEASEEICEIALKHGLVKREPYDPGKHGEDIEADPGCEIWVWQDMKPMGRHSIVSEMLSGCTTNETGKAPIPEDEAGPQSKFGPQGSKTP